MLKSASNHPEVRALVKFWGVRGTTPTPGREFSQHGGNTACVEVRLADGQILIFDAGTGVRRLGQSLMREYAGRHFTVKCFMSHFHWDHIQGIPFFAPLYSPAAEVTFYSIRDCDEVRRTLEGQMLTPYFPVGFDYMSANRVFVKLDENGHNCNELAVRAFPMNHPQGAVGYQIEYRGAKIVYASDLEHGHASLDRVVREYACGADVLIYDAQFTPEEYKARRGWGHSTWLEATYVARDAGVKQLVLIHHDPDHDDSTLCHIVDKACEEFEFTRAASEGSCVGV
jgi:phosphoribosyl 1,2-cyclic phosphodiesterase